MTFAERLTAWCAAIVRLLLPRGPAAIRWLVSAVVVDAVNRVSLGWSRAHVFVKGGEVQPPFADADTSAAVIGVGVASWIEASSLNGVPAVVLGGPSSTVSDASIFDYFGIVATAGFLATALKVGGKNFARLTTITNTKPSGVTVLADAGHPKGGEFVEFVTGDVPWLHSSSLPRDCTVYEAAL